MNIDFDLVYAAVLAGALMHAVWNALVKGSADTWLSAINITVWSGILAAGLLPWLPQPEAASWPFILVSLVLQVSYMRLVARVYKVTDMSVGYPIMRGTAPLLVAMVSVLILREDLGVWALGGILAICAGILCIGLPARRRTQQAAGTGGLRLALLTAAVIAAYTLVDGTGVRLSQAPAAYTLWIFLTQGLVMLALGLSARGPGLLRELSGRWGPGLLGGAGSLISYGTALWAMTLAPIPVVAALRETSILFGMLISGLVLHERLTRQRLLGAGILVLGAALLRLG
ncbi:EamA family transporter [Castellaniella sp.]|uniref:EamA family transporter n=1 Tax=Castellaniella sp. TaxID=1955812 RepID=UPI003C75949D